MEIIEKVAAAVKPEKMPREHFIFAVLGSSIGGMITAIGSYVYLRMAIESFVLGIVAALGMSVYFRWEFTSKAANDEAETVLPPDLYV